MSDTTIFTLGTMALLSALWVVWRTWRVSLSWVNDQALALAFGPRWASFWTGLTSILGPIGAILLYLTKPVFRSREADNAATVTPSGAADWFEQRTIGDQNTNPPEADLCLVVIDTRIAPKNHLVGKRYPLLEGNHVIGRAPVRELQAYPLTIEEDQSISRNHIYLEQQPDGSFLVMDRHSTYGTRLNNQRLLPNKEYPFKPGDVLRLGNTSFQLAPIHIPVQPVALAAISRYHLRVEVGPDQGVRRTITTKPMVIGRAENSDWQLHDPGVARYHAEVCQMADEVTIRALGKNPTLYVNNIASTSHTLSEGDIVRLGETQVIFELAD